MQIAIASDSATSRKTAEKQRTGVEIALSGGIRPGVIREAAVPDLLSQEDVARYQEIFLVQESGNWSRADQLIAALKDDVLLGHVLAQRYMHPTAYRSRYRELKRWLAKYADHPIADRIYSLAMRRKPASERAPKRPMTASLGRVDEDWTSLAGVAMPEADRPKERLTHEAYNIRRKAIRYLRRGLTLAAKRVITSSAARRALPPVAHDNLRGELAFAYYIHGRNDWALDWAEKALRSGEQAPLAAWTAGLASWRAGDRDGAAKYFEIVGNSTYADPWLRAAGAFWAARSHLVSRRPDRVNHWLSMAGALPRTFYGALARRTLGLKSYYDWDSLVFTDQHADLLMATPAGRRALALTQIGQDSRAEKELKRLLPKASPNAVEAMLALASRRNMPGISLRLGDLYEARTNRRLDGAVYPLPAWSPRGGFQVDRALMFAVMRQESRFLPDARSRAGATGLMQLMPSTAAYIANDSRLRSDREKLVDPAFNMALGQKYVNYLIDHKQVGDDLFSIVAAYNGGPGNLARWKRSIDHQDDPLLFIESIPSRETRIYVERVLTNFWIYRDRLGQDTPSLDQLAAGIWPRYQSLDGYDLQVAGAPVGN
jgi:soluble lytic murein transglycosylase-like protein